MITSNKSFCFIPAKAASTRLKKKNILPLAGKEMLYYPIHNAISSHLFDPTDVIVSSESLEVQEIARKYKASVPYTREEHLARDPYGIVDVLLDFLARFPNYQSYESCCILVATAPLMLPEDIMNSYNVYSENNFNSVMSTTPTDHNSLRSVFVENHHIKAIHPECIDKRSQELETTYRLNGAVTWINIAEFLKTKTYFMDPWGAYVMPNERSIDIDNQSDYLYAQFLLGQKKNYRL
jgi:CMP-N,N'-diacetyllegionaminic acid synthase